MPARRWSATSSYTKNIPPVTTPTSTGATVGFAAIGKSPSGFCRVSRDLMPGASPIRFPACRNGRSSTISGAAWSPPPCCCCCWATGCCFPTSAPSDPCWSSRSLPCPALLSAAVELFRKPREVSLALHLRGLVGSSGRQLGQALLTFVFLPYDAFVSLDAIGRTLVRLLVTRKRLLEWQTASDAERTARNSPGEFYATMWIAPVVALACGSFLALTSLLSCRWRRPSWRCGWLLPG